MSQTDQNQFGNLDIIKELAEFKNKSIPNCERQVIINDDLGAFINLSQMLGRASRRTSESETATGANNASTNPANP